MKRRQQGAALLMAMLTVTLVATLAAAALWQHWRDVEVESAERRRQQMAWMLQGALDWSRLILIEDGRVGGADHLSEPWSVPLREARLSGFLSADGNADADMLQAFLSGQITDAQSLLNVANLVQSGKPHGPTIRAFARLFQRLKLPAQELDRLMAAWMQTQAPAADGAAAASAGDVPGAALLRPQRLEQLAWLGVPVPLLQALQAHVVLLPEPTPVNLNTASSTVLHAALPDVDAGQVQALLDRRGSGHFRSVDEALAAAGVAPDPLAAGKYSVASRFFLVRGQLRLDSSTVQEVSLVSRNGTQTQVLWRLREVPQFMSQGEPQSRAASLQ